MSRSGLVAPPTLRSGPFFPFVFHGKLKLVKTARLFALPLTGSDIKKCQHYATNPFMDASNRTNTIGSERLIPAARMFKGEKAV